MYIIKHLSIVIFYVLHFNSCSGYQIEHYKLKYATDYNIGGTEFKMLTNDANQLENIVGSICMHHGLSKISVTEAKKILFRSPKGQVLFAYSDYKNQKYYDLIVLSESKTEQEFNNKKNVYYSYYFYFQSYSKFGGGTEKYAKLKNEIILKLRNEFGEDSIINIKDFWPPKPVPRTQEDEEIITTE